MSTTNPKQSRLVEAAIKKIEKRFAIGQEILEACGPTSPHGKIAQLAERFKINRDTAQKLRAMANPEIGYTKRELGAWFKVFRSQGRALTISHFVRLISVPKGKTRDQLTRDALEKKWSGHRLQVEVLALQGRRREGGRRPTVITGDAFAGEVKQTMWAWDRWLSLHLEANADMLPELAKEFRAMKRLIARVNGLMEE
jgi:hypothetical protein